MEIPKFHHGIPMKFLGFFFSSMDFLTKIIISAIIFIKKIEFSMWKFVKLHHRVRAHQPLNTRVRTIAYARTNDRVRAYVSIRTNPVCTAFSKDDIQLHFEFLQST